MEGELATQLNAGGVAHENVVRCALTDAVGDVREQVARSDYPFALVLAGDGVVLGRVPASALDGDPKLPVEEVMEPGPSTVRPDVTAAAAAKRLADKDLRWAIVTDPEGRLIGVASRDELERDAGG